MSEIVVFGAGGRAGRAAVGEARRRGHEVTAVVRDPAKHADLVSRISYADLAVALLDEIDSPAHHRTHLGLETG